MENTLLEPQKRSSEYRGHAYLSSYFAWILLIGAWILPRSDSYYYWDWSRHLALSYYDGPPMIAYLIKGSTVLFGDTPFSLVILGILALLITTYFVYASAKLFLTTEASYIAAAAWLFTPAVTMELLGRTTYDTPLTVFWAMTVYFVIKYLKYEKKRDLYLCACSMGFMLLSKYSGIVLILSVLVFLIFSRYRRLFNTWHLYISILLIILISSPVLLWNYQHDWISIKFQLAIHQSDSPNTLLNVLKGLMHNLLPVLHLFLILPFICWKRSWYKKDPAIYFCWIVCVVFLVFYLVVARHAVLKNGWLFQYLLTASLLVGVFFQEKPAYRKPISYLLFAGWVAALLSATIALCSSNGWFFPDRQYLVRSFMHSLERDYPQLPAAVLTDSWGSARMLFFLKDKPLFNVVSGCSNAINQYQFWNKEMMQHLAQHHVPEAVYIAERSDLLGCVSQYFDQCTLIDEKTSLDWRKKKYNFYAYLCMNTTAHPYPALPVV